ncbi:hypothetical protein [Iodobacter fluviatilis]|uniref:Uncharacterized protein n=1 Tax=Iodobacter fluviatilis TaxID=537 RepID=A0A377Q2J3_9NEIS|nr:hypothetical protein [Iodobacter fluviatilis]TCU90459.1 hypothetical protein EV682_101492 [Iodobacter fluviatilis]STQ89486.1 Uncharacterised protein [Iodobacter fluviatilis]
MIVREWEKLQFIDPERALIALRKFATTQSLYELPYEIASLRKRELRPFGESRQCALFCQGLSHIMGRKVVYAQYEHADYDFVARFEKDEVLHYAPIQMKELVPEELNPHANLQSELNKLEKYADSKDLVIAIHINRAATVHLSKLVMPRTSLGALWFFGANDQTQNTWTIIGNLLRPGASSSEFTHP